MYADFLPLMVGDNDVIRGPGGDGRAAVVGRDDIAEVASIVLLEPDAHVDATYVLTGPEALTFAEIADAQVDAWVSTYVAVAEGDLATVSDDVQRLTGHPAASFADVIRRGW